MRILVYGINYAPELTGIGKYTAEMCAWLARQGHEVRVVTAPPYYPEWRVHERYRKTPVRTEQIDGVQVERCRTWVPAKPTGLKRVLHLSSFALSSFPRMLRMLGWRPHVVMLIEPPIFCVPAAWLTARLCGARAWLHVQDLEIDAAFELGIVPTALKKFVCALERIALGRFDGVSTISKKMQLRLIRKSVAPERCYLFANWVSCRTIHPLSTTSDYRRELGIPEQAFVALYAGNMGEKQGLEMILDAAKHLAHDTDVCFVMCGDGAVRARLQAAGSELKNIRWLPLQPCERLNQLLGLADVHLLPQRAGVAELVMPSKLTGILASGRPVVAAAEPGSELAEVVSQAGDVVVPGDARAMADALLSLKADNALREALGAAARRYAETQLAVDPILSRFEKALLACVTAKPRVEPVVSLSD